MPRRQSKSIAVQSLLKKAAGLSQSELRALVSGLQGLMQIEVERDEYGKPPNQEGNIEEKYINGCGPYRYLRYWEGKIHRSVYLGKKEG
ncbi:MAG: hypothetical protein HC852_23710 [Acaryochloridaceae cyanobacterium RU_4_10]|nr:hypothetical protein [Acaryochloridaceae cyanobacterium RU_4_10]